MSYYLAISFSFVSIFSMLFFKLLVFTFQHLPKYLGEGKNLERQNIDRPIFRNFKIANIKITKDELFDSSILQFIF